ncbi:MAG: hypothetical protein ACRDDH_15290 [Cetobacterium sp.]|uniref:hypothetical protein n=1 Tax=Cetobacterium sp. TaxID=2071632 RepID=UPI003EE6EFE3
MRKSYDRHLNIFWSYNGKPYLEDNLTRAFITTLSFLNKAQQIEFINFFIGDKVIEEDDVEISFDLQNPYLDIDKEIKKAKRRIMIGFNPSGKCWGNQEDYEILDNIESYQFEEGKLNSDNYINYLSKKLPLEITLKLKEIDELGISYAENVKDIILSYLNRGGSRPDAWIFIHKNSVLDVAIAIETKLWDLDPEQLANHCKECLDIPKEEVKYKKFKETFDKLKKLEVRDKTSILSHFLDYMEKIGYYTNMDEITRDDFDKAFTSKEEDSKLGRELLNRKFNKFFNSYFKSKEWGDLKNKEKYDVEENKRRISIEAIGMKGLGNIYFDTYFDDSFEGNENKKIVFFIGTEIGVANKYANELFSKKLKDVEFKEKLNELYPQRENEEYVSRFEILFRVNQSNYTEYIFLKEDKSLNNILNIKDQIPYKGSLSKAQCIENIASKKFEKYIDKNNLQQIQKIEKRGGDKSTATNYNLMSYLRFIDYVKLDSILEINEIKFNAKFSRILEKHLYGLQKINKEVMSK